ncbi:polyketide cyclase [Streptomyces sp. NBC_00056]|uniref:SRPBCC family protein n=1 Tax=unclassified Streptomyces TaxID=2593676 RepID=UPI002E34F94E|nr:SRPBCC family protein [Streptomyces sp. NBC_01280]WSE13882.1 polyketide cyclase [Streptomyces sp. NBC_01397]
MDWNRYRFRSVWDLPAELADVFAALERAEEYPLWWPQVREATPLDERRGTARFRSLLPYDLFVTATALRRDIEAGVLEITMSGDLEGWVRWTVCAQEGGTRALYEQEVEVCKPLLRRFALVGRPVFLANHALMMRGGRRGLVAHLRRC